MRKIINFSLLLIITISLSASELKWYSFEEAYDIAKSENKTILIDFYTDWCGWCKKMDRETYSDQSIIKMLNNDFVVVKINPEKEGYITTDKGKIQYSQLARELGVRSFPSTGFFTKDFQLIDVIPGYYDPENMTTLLAYMSDKYYEIISFQDYRLFKQVQEMAQAKDSSPKLNYILGYFYLKFFNDKKLASENFQTALSNNLKNKEVYAALSLSSSDSKKWMDKAKQLGYKDDSELDNLAIAYVKEIFSNN